MGIEIQGTERILGINILRIRQRSRPGLVNKNALPKFVFRKRIWHQSLEGYSLAEMPISQFQFDGVDLSDTETILACYDINAAIREQRFPTTLQMSVELGALLAQIEWGDALLFDVGIESLLFYYQL